jgi:hypothetical protein
MIYSVGQFKTNSVFLTTSSSLLVIYIRSYIIQYHPSHTRTWQSVKPNKGLLCVRYIMSMTP